MKKQLHLKIKLFSLFLVMIFSTVISAQTGYIYLHHQATNEEGSPNFTYTLSGGGVQNYTLNDQTDFLSSEDIGGSQSGRLWAVARPVTDATFNNFKIYYRDVNSPAWTAVTTPSGSPRAIDGGAGSKAIYSTNAASGAGRVYSIAADGTTTDITGNLPAGIVYDVSDNWVDVGTNIRQYAAVQNGNIYQRNTNILPAVWTLVANTPSHRVDAVPYTSKLYYVVGNSTTAGSTVFYRDVTAGSSISLGAASNTDDIGITEDGTVIAGYKKMNGIPGGTVTWTDDVQGMYGFNVTGGPGSQFWSSVGITNVNNGNTSVRPNRIMTRTAAGIWIDDERIRATGTHNDNSVLLSLTPGTYTISEASEPTGWRLQSIFTDPSATSDVATKSATITVTANSIKNVVFTNVNDIPTAMPTDCTTGFTENFGTTQANYASPTISSAYHNGAPTLNGTSSSAMGYGYYGLIKNSNQITGDLASGNGVEYTTGFTDHTSGTGRMLGVNSTGQSRIFYQKRLTGLILGVVYNYSVWVRSADINAGNLPNIGLQVLHPTTDEVLFSTSSGMIANANPPAAWKQVTLSFTATTGNIDIALVNLTAGAWGNDFAVDDIMVIPVKPPAPVIDVITQPTCSTLGSVTFRGLPAIGTWTISDTNGGATITGTGTAATFSNLVAGNHTFTITLGTCVSNPSANITINAASSGSTSLGPVTGPTCIIPAVSNQVYSVPVIPGATSYTWTYSGTLGGSLTDLASMTTNSITVSFGQNASSGILSVTATTACGTSAPSTLAVTIVPTPSIISLNETTICPVGGSIILTSTPEASYQWYKDNVLIPGATNQNYTASAGGNYTVVTASGSCVSSASAPFTVIIQDTTAPVFVSPLGTQQTSVKLDFDTLIGTSSLINLPQTFGTGGASATFRQSTPGATVKGFISTGYPTTVSNPGTTANPAGPAAYGEGNVLGIVNTDDPIRNLAVSFPQSVTNLRFSLFDLDGVSIMSPRAYNNGVLQPIRTIPLKTSSPNVTVDASPSATPTITGVNGGWTIASTRGMRTAGANIEIDGPVNSFVIASVTRTNGDQDYNFSDIFFDYTSPILPPDITVDCNAVPAPVVLTATDNCSAATVSYTQVPATYTPSSSIQIITRTWIATDSTGNTTTHIQKITVNPSSVAPVAEANQNICATNYSTLANIAVKGINIKWYADASATTQLPPTTVLTNGATYFATQTTSACESSRVAVTVALRNCSWVNPSLRFKAGR